MLLVCSCRPEQMCGIVPNLVCAYSQGHCSEDQLSCAALNRSDVSVGVRESGRKNRVVIAEEELRGGWSWAVQVVLYRTTLFAALALLAL
jgi:hypothetical protein